MTFIEKVKAALFNPGMFYQRIRTEVGIIEAFKYLIILSIVYTVMALISSFFITLFLSSIFLGNYPSPLFTLASYSIFGIFQVVASVIWFFVLIVGSFILAGIMHLLTKIFGGKNDFSATYKVTVYSLTPVLLIGWIPYVGVLTYFYAWYLYIKGLSILHDISIGRAFLVTLIPIIIISILVGALAFFFLTSIFYTARTPIDMIPTGKISSILSKYLGMY